MQRLSLCLLAVLLGLVSYTQRLQFSSVIATVPAKHQAEHTDIIIDQSTEVLAPLPKVTPRRVEPPSPVPPVLAEPADYQHPERQLITI